MKPDWYDIPSKKDADPEIPNLHLFEGEYRKFLRGDYDRVLDEDWERFYAQQKKEVQVHLCEHGLRPLRCSKCYFNPK